MQGFCFETGKANVVGMLPASRPCELQRLRILLRGNLRLNQIAGDHRIRRIDLSCLLECRDRSFGLAEAAGNLVKTYSGGMRRRLDLAASLVGRPRFLYLDEPTTGQDLRQSLEVMNFLKDLWQNEGHTIVIITHEMPIVAQYAQRVVVLGQGQVLMDGSTREVFAEPELLAKTFVKPPQIARLAQALTGHGIPRDLLSVPEMISAFNKAREENLASRANQKGNQS